MTIETTETVELTLDSPSLISEGDVLLRYDAGCRAVKTREPFVVETVSAKPDSLPGDAAFIVTSTAGRKRYLQDLALTVQRTEQHRWVVRANFESRFAIGDRVDVTINPDQSDRGHVLRASFSEEGTVYDVELLSGRVVVVAAQHLRLAPVYFEGDEQPQAGEVWMTQEGVCLLAGAPGDIDRFGERGEYADRPWPDNQRWMSFGVKEDRNLTWHCSPGDYPLRRLVDADGQPTYLTKVAVLRDQLAKEEERRAVARRTSDERHAHIQLGAAPGQADDEAPPDPEAELAELRQIAQRFLRMRRAADEYIYALDYKRPKEAALYLEDLRTAVRLPGGPR